MKKIINTLVLVFLAAGFLNAGPDDAVRMSHEFEDALSHKNKVYDESRIQLIVSILRRNPNQANAVSFDGMRVLSGFIVSHSSTSDQAGYLKIVEALIQNGALIDLNDTDPGGYVPARDTPLHYAVKYNNIQLVALMLRLQLNANVNCHNARCKTPYDLAKSDEMRALLMRYMPQVVVRDAATGAEAMGIQMPGARGAVYTNLSGFGSASGSGGRW